METPTVGIDVPNGDAKIPNQGVYIQKGHFTNPQMEEPGDLVGIRLKQSQLKAIYEKIPKHWKKVDYW